MVENLLIYEVQKNDTLFSIAEGIGMTSEDLRNFHNANCQKVGLLLFNGLTGIQKIVIPKIYKSEEKIRQENRIAVPPKIVSPGFFAQRYQVSESYESDYENKVEIDYSLDLKLQEDQKDSGKSLIASVRCFDFKKEGSKPADKMSELSMACMESISPLQFKINLDGKISGIHEFKNIQKIFEEKRKDLEDFFIGEIATKYMDKFAASISNESYFEKQIQSTLLYQVLFPSMNWFYRESAWKEEFYLVKNSFPLNCIFNVTFDHINSEEIQSDLRGEISENVSLQEMLRGKRSGEEAEEQLIGLVELKYTTHKKTKQLITAEGGIALLLQDEIYRKQKIKLSKI